MKNFTEVFAEEEQAKLVKKVSKLKPITIEFKAIPKGGGYVEIAAMVGKNKLGNLHVRNLGGDLRNDFSEPTGVMLNDEIYSLVRNALGR